MVTKIIEIGKTSTALVLLGCMLGASMAFAQMPDPETERVSCNEVNWRTGWDVELLSHFPRIADGCHEVVVRDGIKWIRFEADFVRLNRDGSVVSTFKNPRGRSIGNLTLMPAEGQRVMLSGRSTSFSDLLPGQELNFYVPEGTFAFASEPAAPRGQVARVVAVEEEPTRLAQVEPRTTTAQQPTRLPRTAGPLPLVALGALLSLMAGIGVGIRRRLGSESR